MKDAKELKLMTTDDAVAQIQDNMILELEQEVQLNY